MFSIFLYMSYRVGSVSVQNKRNGLNLTCLFMVEDRQ